jgi:DNA-directed RNA polymerase subunit RPC12/RpoP
LIRRLTGVDARGFRARRCNHGARCGDCQSAKNCAAHWQHLLSNKGTLVHLQCPDCGHLWSIDTRDRTIRRYKAA